MFILRGQLLSLTCMRIFRQRSYRPGLDYQESHLIYGASASLAGTRKEVRYATPFLSVRGTRSARGKQKRAFHNLATQRKWLDRGKKRAVRGCDDIERCRIIVSSTRLHYDESACLECSAETRRQSVTRGTATERCCHTRKHRNKALTLNNQVVTS